MKEGSVTVSAPRTREMIEKLRVEIARTIRGKVPVIDRVICCLLSGGHVLVEDLPGLGKTTLAHSLAHAIDCDFSRIQFTSDLLPSDIIGVSIYDEREREFVYRRGPIFANIVLADEINRSTPKTQSSLLEVMDRARVTVDGKTYNVGKPFLVIATQNPVDYEGTFPLPDSQMDRFLMRIEMGYPDFQHEVDILASRELRYDAIEGNPVLNGEAISDLQAQVREVFVETSVIEYIVKIIHATRTEAEFRTGASPRGAIALRTTAQAWALMNGRSFVLPEDIASLVAPVLGHRLVLRRQANDPIEARRLVESCLRNIVAAIPQPS